MVILHIAAFPLLLTWPEVKLVVGLLVFSPSLESICCQPITVHLVLINIPHLVNESVRLSGTTVHEHTCNNREDKITAE